MFILLQKLLPLHALSRLVGYLAYWRAGFLKDAFIRFFVRHYQVNLDEIADFNPRHYVNFNEFFTRHLKPGVRPIAAAPNAIISPVDGAISEFGDIQSQTLLQAKGHTYSLQALLGGDAVTSAQFVDGKFMTIYLAPKDYHRVHMPVTGQLLQMLHVPGQLFSVNQATVAAIPGLFARNERVISLFKTDLGPMAVILVGATCVGSMEMKWHGIVTPPATHKVQRWEYLSQNLNFARADELGHFNMGSTVILLFAKNALHWNADLKPNSVLKMGQQIAII